MPGTVLITVPHGSSRVLALVTLSERISTQSRPDAGRVTTASAGTLPGIGADVVMVAAGRQEYRRTAIFGHSVETELLVPPGLGLFRPADAQMDMANDGVFRRTLPSGVAGRHFGDNRWDV